MVTEFVYGSCKHKSLDMAAVVFHWCQQILSLYVQFTTRIVLTQFLKVTWNCWTYWSYMTDKKPHKAMYIISQVHTFPGRVFDDVWEWIYHTRQCGDHIMWRHLILLTTMVQTDIISLLYAGLLIESEKVCGLQHSLFTSAEVGKQIHSSLKHWSS